MPWIESHSELACHHKTRRLARSLGITVPQTIGHLHLLWWWATAVAEDGDLSCHDPEDIATAMMWSGEPAQLIDALCQAGGPGRHGFLERTPSLRIHDWDVYTAHLRASREKNREKQRRYRERMSAESSNRNIEVIGTSGQYELPEIVKHVLPPVTPLHNTTQQNTTQQDTTVTVPDLFRSETAVSSPASVKKAPKKQVVPSVGPDFEQRMVAKFPMLAPSLIHDQTQLALAHTSATKYANTELYVQNWLRREAERYGNALRPIAETPTNNHRTPTDAVETPSPFAKYR